MTRRAVDVQVWAGDFASQQLAFAHLLDCADRAGAALDLDRVEVVPVRDAARLAHVFGDRAAEVARAAGARDTLVLLVGAGAPFGATARLDDLGVHPGSVPVPGGGPEREA